MTMQACPTPQDMWLEATVTQVFDDGSYRIVRHPGVFGWLGWLGWWTLADVDL